MWNVQEDFTYTTVDPGRLRYALAAYAARLSAVSQPALVGTTLMTRLLRKIDETEIFGSRSFSTWSWQVPAATGEDDASDVSSQCAR